MARILVLAFAIAALPGCAAAPAERGAPAVVEVGAAPRAPAAAPPSDDREPVRFIAVDAANTHGCALSSDGRVWCWGQNYAGELGRGTSGSFNEQAPAPVDGIVDAVALSVGPYLSCIIHRDRSVSCWGAIVAGDSHTHEGRIERPLPQAIHGLGEVKQISVGLGHACALLSNGHVACWGENYAGALGDGTVGVRRVTPVPVAGVARATQLAVGDRYSCARIADGSARCWGENYFAPLGDGTRIDRHRAIEVPGLSDVAEVAPIGEGWNCAIHGDESVSCWGDQLVFDFGDRTPDKSRPIRLPLGGVVELDGVDRVACARTRNGPHRGEKTAPHRGKEQTATSCWGRFDDDRYVMSPTALAGARAIDLASRGWNSVLAVDSDGRVQLWPGPTGGETEGPTGGETEGPTGGETEGPTGGETEGPTGGETEPDPLAPALLLDAHALR